MHLKLMVFLRLFLICLFVSCGNTEDFFDRGGIYEDKEIAHIKKGSPKVYPLADPLCNETNAVSQLGDEAGEVKIWLSLNGEMKLVPIKVSELSGHGLQSEVIADTLWGYEMSYETYCSKTKADLGAVCGETKIRVKSRGKRLHFCKKGGGYPRESLENVALASMVGILKTHKVHKSVFPDEKVEKVTLLVHPLISDHQFNDYQKIQNSISLDIDKIRTDNAYWFPDDKDQFFIAVVPEGAETYGDSKKPRIWEMPAITSHEWGHHLFQHYAPPLADPMGSDLVSFTHHLRLVTSAINESFADIVAYCTYLLEYKEFGWFLVQGDHFSREVSERRWSDGTFKTLNRWFLDHYFRQTDNLNIQKHQPNPTDNHAVGAVLAHGLYRIFSENRETPTVSNLHEAFRRTIAWGKTMNDNVAEDSKTNPYEFMERAITHGSNLLNKEEHILDDGKCTTFREVFPVFKNLTDTCRAN